MWKKSWCTALLLCAFSGAWAEPVKVLTGFSILGDLARQIGGERVEVSTMIGADQDAHVYQLTPQDIRAMRQVDLILLNGLGFESAETERAAAQTGLPVAFAAQGIEARKNDHEHEHEEHADEHEHEHEEHADGHEHEEHADEHEHEHEEHADEHEHEEHTHHHHHHGAYDPHVWHDPILMKQYVANIAEALIKVDPEGKAYYSARLAQYQGELDELNRWIVKKLSPIAEKDRKVLTAHDAFGYFSARYHVHFIAPQGVSEDSEPSAKQMAAIIRQVKEDNIRVIFMENIKNPRLIEQLAREVKVKPAGKLYSDALSQSDEASTYLNLIRYNVNAITNALTK